MKTQKTRNTVLALVGLVALTLYILACTSFSPDDTKVLYPALDEKSGAIGMAVYDRETRRSEMLFLPMAYDNGLTNPVAPRLLRGQWFPDGRRILVGWAGGKNEDEGLNLAVIPWGVRSPVKVFRVPGIKDAAELFTVPLCLVGDQVLFMASEKEVGRVNLQTGATAIHEFADASQKVALYPAPDGAGVFYVEQGGGLVFGRLDPQNFNRTPLTVITNEPADKTFFAYGKDGKVVAFAEKSDDGVRLVVWREGKLIFTRPLGATTDERAFGNAGFSPQGDLLWATFRKPSGTNRVAYGLMEIPLSDGRIRETVLIAEAPSGDDFYALYFQAGLAHDGKTAAVASTYLACATEEFKPADCALFLVDLNDPKRKVTKVPIPLPANRPDLK